MMSANPSPFAHYSKKRNAPRGPMRQPSCQREVVWTEGSLPYAWERFLAIDANVVPTISRPTITTKGQVAFPVNAVSHGGVAHGSDPGFAPPAPATDVVVEGEVLVEVEVEGGGVDEVDGGGVEVVDGGGVDDVVGGGLVGGGLVGGGDEDGGTISQAPMSRDAFVAGPS
jgi:hypothetical protein